MTRCRSTLTCLTVLSLARAACSGAASPSPVAGDVMFFVQAGTDALLNEAFSKLP